MYHAARLQDRRLTPPGPITMPTKVVDRLINGTVYQQANINNAGSNNSGKSLSFWFLQPYST
ncbi:hypothetical protein ACSS6W_009150 [Trichoderma asperelloides]